MCIKGSHPVKPPVWSQQPIYIQLELRSHFSAMALCSDQWHHAILVLEKELQKLQRKAEYPYGAVFARGMIELTFYSLAKRGFTLAWYAKYIWDFERYFYALSLLIHILKDYRWSWQVTGPAQMKKTPFHLGFWKAVKPFPAGHRNVRRFHWFIDQWISWRTKQGILLFFSKSINTASSLYDVSCTTRN